MEALNKLIIMIRTEPARAQSLVVAVIALLSLTGLSDDAGTKILGVAIAVIGILGGEAVRNRVAPVAKLGDNGCADMEPVLVDEDGEEIDVHAEPEIEEYTPTHRA